MPKPFKAVNFGRYLLTERLAIGGMAEIFGAKIFGAMGFEKAVVIKRILPQFGTDAEFLRMFITEAKLVCHLEHPNIVQVHELGEIDGQYYIAMEFVNGIDGRQLWRTLAKRKQRLPGVLALFTVSEFLKGLDYAHRAVGPDNRLLGVVHRDVSPSNILISFRGDVKIGDFGIALVQQESKTQAGVLKGKYGYMSPEQVAGLKVDHRSDIFAAGIVLAELLLGRRLFLGRSDFETLDKVMNVRLDVLEQHEKALPPEVVRIVRLALQREPADRYQSAREFHDDIVEFLYEHGERVTNETLAAFTAQHVAPFLTRRGETRTQTEAGDESQAAAVRSPVLPSGIVPRDVELTAPTDEEMLAHTDQQQSYTDELESQITGEHAVVEDADGLVAIDTGMEPAQGEGGDIVVDDEPLAEQPPPAAAQPPPSVAAQPRPPVAAQGALPSPTTVPASIEEEMPFESSSKGAEASFSGIDLDPSAGGIAPGDLVVEGDQPLANLAPALGRQQSLQPGQDAFREAGAENAPGGFGTEADFGGPADLGMPPGPGTPADFGASEPGPAESTPQTPLWDNVIDPDYQFGAIPQLDLEGDEESSYTGELDLDGFVEPEQRPQQDAVGLIEAPGTEFDLWSPEEEVNPALQIAPVIDEPKVMVSAQLQEAEETKDQPDFAGQLSSRTVAKVLFRFGVVNEAGLLTLTGPEVGGQRAEDVAWLLELQAQVASKTDGKRSTRRTCEIRLEEGQPRLISADRSEEALVSYLMSNDVLDREKVDKALRANPHRSLVAALLTAGRLSPLHISRHLTAFVLETVLDTFSWEDGTFAFYRDKEASDEAFPTGLELFELVSKGVGALDEPTLDRYFERLRGRRLLPSQTPPAPIDSFDPDKVLYEVYRSLARGYAAHDTIDSCSQIGDPLAIKRSLYLLVECELADVS